MIGNLWAVVKSIVDAIAIVIVSRGLKGLTEWGRVTEVAERVPRVGVAVELHRVIEP